MLHLGGKIILRYAFVISLIVSQSDAAELKGPIRLAVLPCSNIEMTFRKFYPLVSYVKQETGYDVRLVVPNNFQEYERAIRSNEVDFALQDAHTYVKLEILFDNSDLVKTLTMDGEPTLCGVLIVRKGSHIRKISDLKGKTVMFGPKTSGSKWVAARLLFEENGIKIDKDLKAYINGGCCEDIAFGVFLKSVDAGVVCDHFLAEHEEKQKELGVEAQKIEVIGRTKPVPTRVLAARKGVSRDIVTSVDRTLLKLDKNNPEHAKIMYRAELGGFRRAEDRDYNALRQLLTAHKVD
jgi:phosphonate transport system substrate-binding protein